MTISELEQAVTKLSDRDVKSGRLDNLLAEVDKGYTEGLSKPL